MKEKLKRAVIKEELVALTGNFIGAVILNQFIYWSERVTDFDKFIAEEKKRRELNGESINIDKYNGWIYKTAEELSTETMLDLSVKTIRTYIKKLIENGWLDERNNPKYKWDKTKQYRVNLIKIQKDLQKIGYALDEYPLLSEVEKMPLRNGEITNHIFEITNQSGEITNHIFEITNQSSKNERAIPEITTETSTETNTKNKENIYCNFDEETPSSANADTTDTEFPDEFQPLDKNQNRVIRGKTVERIPYQEVVDMYNETCVSMPKVLELTDKRKKAIKTLINHFKGDLDKVMTVFIKAEESDFLSGRNGKWTGCNFDWLINKNNAVKVLEDTYINHAIMPENLRNALNLVKKTALEDDNENIINFWEV